MNRKVNSPICQPKFSPIAADWLIVKHDGLDEYAIERRKATAGEQRFDIPNLQCSDCRKAIQNERANLVICDPEDPSGRSMPEKVNDRISRYRGCVLILCWECDRNYRFKPFVPLNPRTRALRERFARDVINLEKSCDSDEDEG